MLTVFVGLPFVLSLLTANVSFRHARWMALTGMGALFPWLCYAWWCFDASGSALGFRGATLLLMLSVLLFPLVVLCVPDTRSLASILLLAGLVHATLLMWDILAFYVLFEACAVPLLLIISRGPGWHRFGGESSPWQAPLRHKLHAAYRLLMITVFGSLIALPLLLLLSQEQGSSRFAHLWWVGTGAGSSTYAGALLWCGLALVFGIKLPLLPVHLWLPEAHVAAPTAGSVLLSGIFLKLGGYGFLFLSLPLCTVAHVYLNPILWVLAWLGFALGSLATLRQVDLKKVIAYSSIVHMALLPLALFSLSEVSITGSFLLMLAHGLVSPALFVLAGQMFDRHHTEFLVYLASRGFLMPVWRTLFLFMSLANAGLPLFPDFVAEFLLLQSLFATHPWPAFAICAMLVLPSAYSFWTYARLTFSLTRH